MSLYNGYTLKQIKDMTVTVYNHCGLLKKCLGSGDLLVLRWVVKGTGLDKILLYRILECWYYGQSVTVDMCVIVR